MVEHVAIPSYFNEAWTECPFRIFVARISNQSKLQNRRLTLHLLRRARLVVNKYNEEWIELDVNGSEGMAGQPWLHHYIMRVHARGCASFHCVIFNFSVRSTAH